MSASLGWSVSCGDYWHPQLGYTVERLTGSNPDSLASALPGKLARVRMDTGPFAFALQGDHTVVRCGASIVFPEVPDRTPPADYIVGEQLFAPCCSVSVSLPNFLCTISSLAGIHLGQSARI